MAEDHDHAHCGHEDEEAGDDLVQHFYGATITADKPLTMSLTDTELHITQACRSGVSSSAGPVRLVVTTTTITKPITVCVLTAAAPHALLDLNFFPGDGVVTFLLDGGGNDAAVDISGSCAVPYMTEDEADEEEAAAARQGKKVGGGDDDEDDEDEDDDEEGEDEEGDEEEEEEEAPEGAVPLKSAIRLDAVEKAALLGGSGKAVAAGKAAAAAGPATGSGAALSAIDKLKRKRDEAAAAAAGALDAVARAAKVARTEARADAGSSHRPATTAVPAPAAAAAPPATGGAGALKELAGGKLRLKDTVVGGGPAAGKGNTIFVNYAGKLGASGKGFDKSKNFKLKLGANSVIKGWELGLVGMRVGGKRQLIIHPDLGYGKAGAPPTIPPNATLVFDVELVKMK